MFRKLKLAVAVSLALMPAGGWALGLGSIHTKSGLNQNFSAEIDLVSVNPDELDTIKIQLAGPEDFARLGMDRPFHLTKLRFRPDVSSNGQPVIRVSSSDAMREPYLNFLVEIIWPKGRMVREYTVLLDPPTTARRQAFAVGQRGARAASVPPPERLIARDQDEALPGGPSVEYGPTKTGDTLWSLARRLDVQGASTYQTMMALFRHNPEAFVQGDINLLKTGKILRLPGQQTALGLPSRATGATAALRKQPDLMETGALPATEQGQPAPVMREDELKLVTARPESGQPGVTAAPPPSQAVGKQLQNDLLLAREETAIARKEGDELRNRVEELEGQLTKMQRLMTLQNDHLAQLQAAAQQVTETKEKPPESVAAPKASPFPTPPPVGIGEPAKEPPPPTKHEGLAPLSGSVEAPPSSVIQTPPLVSPPPVITTPVAETPAPTPPAPAIAPVESPKPPVSAEVEPSPQPSVPPKAADESGWLTLLKENTLLISMAGAGIALLGALAALLKRRRKQEDEEFPESILVSPAEEEIARDMARSASSATMTGYSEPSSMQTIQLSSQLSDFGDTDIDTDTQVIPDTGQVDPIAEADVYIAYGRYDQAAELIRQAVSANPDRQDYKFKLAECYAGSGNKTAFLGLARELGGAGLAKTDPNGWKRLTNLAREAGVDLSGIPPGGAATPPATPLRAPTGGGMAAAATATAAVQPTSKAPAPVAQPETELLDLDFDFGDLTAGFDEKPTPRTQPPAADRKDDLASLDFELPEIPVPTQRPAATPIKPPQKTPEEELGELDIFDLSFADEQEPRKEEELSLDGFVDYPHTKADRAQEPQVEEHELSLEGFELTEDEYTEVDTKLELAQAYIEMGDPEDAKSILEEVLIEGNEGQVRRARQMLGGLS